MSNEPGLTDAERDMLYDVIPWDGDYADLWRIVKQIKADARADLAAKVAALEAKLEEVRVVADRPWVTLREVRAVLAADSTPREDQP